jgi:transcription-repair coupling factor (superfamily II helicase)
MDIYRKIAVTKTAEDLKQIESDLTDVYGLLPAEVEILLELAGLRIEASKRGIKSIVASGRDLIFSFNKDSSVQPDSLFAKVKGTVRFVDPKTVYLRLPQNYFEPRTLINIAKKILGK